MSIKVFFVKSDEGYAVFVPSMPGCLTQGETLAEAKKNLHDAIQTLAEVREEDLLAELAGEAAGDIETVEYELSELVPA
ncbi:MAG: type II toxin-antitoxin system HicB family antitoxin [Planctomycetota bacterium]